MLEPISRILDRCGSSDPVLPPTELYNEGWMLRLVLDWFDRHRDLRHPLSFTPGARWYSEALLPSRFLRQSRADPRAETHTHADGIIGHFQIAPGVRGDATLPPDARQFVVVEAKIGSKLSAGTKNAPNFDQAARTVACTAYMLGAAGIHPAAMDRLAFYVIAPRGQIHSGIFADLVTKESIESKVRRRVDVYNGAFDGWFENTFLPALASIEAALLSWEDVLAALPANEETRRIFEFYAQCLKYDPIPREEQTDFSIRPRKASMIETHPFEAFVPPNAKYLILGSFIGKQAIQGSADYDASYDFYYGTRRNQFWPILEAVYGRELKSKSEKQELLASLGIAMADIILRCERMQGSNLDSNLTNKVYNTKAITEILSKHEIKKVFFTSRFVEQEFRKVFKEIISRVPIRELIALPSPSPRFAKMTKEQKIGRYREVLPKL